MFVRIFYSLFNYITDFWINKIYQTLNYPSYLGMSILIIINRNLFNLLNGLLEKISCSRLLMKKDIFTWIICIKSEKQFSYFTCCLHQLIWSAEQNELCCFSKTNYNLLNVNLNILKRRHISTTVVKDRYIYIFT